MDGERRRPINDVDDDVGQSLLPRPQCRDHGAVENEDEEKEEDDEYSQLSLANIDDVEEPPPLPAEKRFVVKEYPALLNPKIYLLIIVGLQNSGQLPHLNFCYFSENCKCPASSKDS